MTGKTLCFAHPSSMSFNAWTKGPLTVLFSIPPGYTDKELERFLLSLSKQAYDEKVEPGASFQRRVGNAYTASLYIGLAGLWGEKVG
eukprot:scaffold173324_cov17-Tisochrysis_lutea.AAC.1